MGEGQEDGAVITAAEPEELLTLRETVEFLGISKQTLYRMMERGELKGVRVGRQWRFRKADLAAYLERGPAAITLAATPVDLIESELEFFQQRLGRVLPANSDLEANEAKVDLLLQCIFTLAIEARAYTIHLEPARLDGEQVFLVRLRVDGVLHEVRRLPFSMHAVLVSQLKMMLQMNVEEHRLAQDGRLHFNKDGREYDLRVNISPVMFGEAITMWILNQRSPLVGLEQLGFSPDELTRLHDWLHRPAGLVLVVGPSGSGKTTTVYNCLAEIAKPESKTLTIEDPIECQLPWTTQAAVIRKSGFTFPAALRSMMRQDPDIIFAGEIRDLETAELLAQAALTGHLVFSILHSADGPSTLKRLADMGVEPFIIASSLVGVVAQRLIRMLCTQCKQPVELAPSLRARALHLARTGGCLLPDDAQFYRAVGCEACRYTGYCGRTALFELMEFTPEVKEAFLRGAPVSEITTAAVLDGMTTLTADGIRRAAMGLTSVEEVLRVTFDVT